MTHSYLGHDMNDETVYKIMLNIIAFFISYVLTYAELSADQMIAYAVLIGIDYVTGIVKAYHIGENITSNRMKYGVISKFSLLIVPIALGIGSKATGIDFRIAITMFINILVISEVYSIISNVYAISKGKELPEYDALAIVARHIREYLIKKGE